jgi:beta-glucosidase
VSIVEGLVGALGPGVTVLHHRGIPTYAELADRTAFTTDAAGTVPGVNVEVFDNTTLSGTPWAVRVDQHVNLTGPFVPPRSAAGANRAADSSARWTGYFTAAGASPHRLFVHDFRGEGGCRATVDASTVIDNWRVSRATLSEATLALAPGPHKVVLECFRRRLPGSTSVVVRMGIVPESALVEDGVAAMAARADAVVAAVGFDNQTETESGDRTFALPAGQDLLLRDILKGNRKVVVAVNAGGGVEMAPWIDAVPAVVMTWFAGEQGGAALAQLLTGDADFSGRLPITIERRWEDNPNSNFYYPQPGTASVTYGNGVFVGYRGYEKNGTAPLFPFGFGLSYTTFAYGNLSVEPARGANGPAFRVAFDVTNTGARAGADVAQVYVAPPEGSPVPRPRKELRGFAKVELRPAETRRVTVDLDGRAFSYWDTASHRWKVDTGTTWILVGPSSASTPLRQPVTVASAAAATR